MARVIFDIHTSLPPARVMSMLTDFSPRRPDVWPALAPELYQVHRLEPGSADVKEGSLYPTLIWERDLYEWSADRVRWTVRESNYCQPGSYVEVTVRPRGDGGTRQADPSLQTQEPMPAVDFGQWRAAFMRERTSR